MGQDFRISFSFVLVLRPSEMDLFTFSQVHLVRQQRLMTFNNHTHCPMQFTTFQWNYERKCSALVLHLIHSKYLSTLYKFLIHEQIQVIITCVLCERLRKRVRKQYCTMFCCAVDCLSRCCPAPVLRQGCKSYGKVPKLGQVWFSVKTASTPAMSSHTSQQGNKQKLLLSLVLCPARSATAYFVPLSLRPCLFYKMLRALQIQIVDENFLDITSDVSEGCRKGFL